MGRSSEKTRWSEGTLLLWGWPERREAGRREILSAFHKWSRRTMIRQGVLTKLSGIATSWISSFIFEWLRWSICLMWDGKLSLAWIGKLLRRRTKIYKRRLPLIGSATDAPSRLIDSRLRLCLCENIGPWWIPLSCSRWVVVSDFRCLKV